MLRHVVLLKDPVTHAQQVVKAKEMNKTFMNTHTTHTLSSEAQIKHQRNVSLACLLSCILASVLISLTMPTSALAQADIPESQNYEGIQFITGGIGSEESDAMLELGKKWPLTLEFAQDHPARPLWVADVTLKITNSKRKVVFKAISDGPIMLLNLPADQYELEAVFEGRTIKRKIKLEENKFIKLPMIWPIR
jgi:hypothetical protein